MQLPITHPYGVAFTDSSEPCHAVSGRYVAISENDRRGRNAQGQVSGNAVLQPLSETCATSGLPLIQTRCGQFARRKPPLSAQLE